jgi:hypothetical protein
LDYYHSPQDRYLLVDELEIAVLSRERARLTGLAADGPQAVALVAGAGCPLGAPEVSLGEAGVQAALDCRPGVAQASAALPRPPSAVLVDGSPVPFQYHTPERVVTFDITTPSFSDEQRATSLLDRLGRAIIGGPPYLYARFDRALFLPEVGPGGEAADYAGSGVDERRWRYIKLGPWREQGRDLADVTAGWYRMTFGLPSSDGWTIPYYLDLDLRGAGKVYFNGRPIASVGAGGRYRLPVPSTLAERDNVLALALSGLSPDTGLYSAEIAADESRMTRRRTVQIRF